MEQDIGTVIAAMAGGIFGIWVLQTILDVALISRIMDDPVNGKVLATVSAYVLACLLYLIFANSAAGIAYYLPGALLIGYLQYRKGLKLRAKITEENPSETFE